MATSANQQISEYKKEIKAKRISCENTKIAGATILYNPDLSVIKNISSYIDYIDVLYVIDNSDKPLFLHIKEYLLRHHKICYVSLSGNHGMAKALNIAAQKSISDNYFWLFTMDQDSSISKNIFPDLLTCLNTYKKDNIGIICSKYTSKNKYCIKSNGNYSEILVAITSGSLLNISAYISIGPFMEKLFIDQVDHEYCLRLSKNGYKIIQVNNTMINHNLGNSKKYFLIKSSNHNPIRRYFMTRNRFYVSNMYKNEYPIFRLTEICHFLWETLMIILLERDKILKLKYIIIGYFDYKKKIFNRFV